MKEEKKLSYETREKERKHREEMEQKHPENPDKEEEDTMLVHIHSPSSDSM